MQAIIPNIKKAISGPDINFSCYEYNYTFLLRVLKSKNNFEIVFSSL